MPSSVSLPAARHFGGDRLRYGGHAPGHLREAFLSYLSGEDENLILDDFWHSERKQAWWATLTPAQRLNWLCGKLGNCTDTLPWDMRSGALQRLDLDERDHHRVASYAQVAQALMRARSRRRGDQSGMDQPECRATSTRCARPRDTPGLTSVGAPGPQVTP